MFLHKRNFFVFAAAAVLTIAPCRSSSAAPILSFSAADLGGGLFEYDFTLENSEGTVPLAGLLLLHGSTAFGLDATSTIGAPQDVNGDTSADWDFFAPDPGPPLVDQLDFFSLSPAGDIAVGASLGGFTFQSFRNPGTLTAADLSAIAVGSSGEQFPISIPEPASLILLVMGTGMMAMRRRMPR